MTFKNPVHYHLTNDQDAGDAGSAFKKILDYLLTFTGDIGIEKEGETAVISYTDTPLTATLKATGKLNRQLTLTCEKEDNISVNLLKNITKNINYRIFNAQTLSYLVNDPTVLDLTTATIEKNIFRIIKKYGLTPLFQYRDSLVFYAKDRLGRINLINRHLLEYLKENPQKRVHKTAFSIIIAKDIGHFVALFDRGLIPLSYYKGIDNDTKIINLSDFDINRLQRNIHIEKINFLFNQERQSFTQGSSELIEIRKGKNLVRSLKLKKYLAIKIAQDIGYSLKGKTLVPKLKVLVFLDS